MNKAEQLLFWLAVMRWSVIGLVVFVAWIALVLWWGTGKFVRKNVESGSKTGNAAANEAYRNLGVRSRGDAAGPGRPDKRAK